MKRAVADGFGTSMRSRFAGRLVGKTPPQRRPRVAPEHRLTHSALDLQEELVRNLHACLLCAVQPGYRLTYACDMD